MKIVVFDFDKTLTKGDTFNQFVVYTFKLLFNKLELKEFLILFIKCGFDYFSVIFKFKSLMKFKNDLLNKFIVYIEDYNDHIINFSKSVTLNLSVVKLLKEYHSDKRCKVFIISASDEYLIRVLFKEVEVIGMKFMYKSINRSLAIVQHPYSDEKVKLLNDLYNVFMIDIFYTDSFIDLPCINISQSSYLVNGEKIKRINNEHINF